MFEVDEETAANVETQEQEIESKPTSPVEQVDQTKAFAKRLKEEKEKARIEERNDIAKSFGYETWDAYMDAQTNNKLLDKGLDPDAVRPVLKDLIKNDPEYIEAMNYKAEKERLEQEIFATNSLKLLNDTFGTNFKSVEELDEDTVKMWNNGTPIVKAYAANNWSKLRDTTPKKVVDNGKSHLQNLNGSTEQGTVKEYTKKELDVFSAFGISKDAAIAWRKSHK